MVNKTDLLNCFSRFLYNLKTKNIFALSTHIHTKDDIGLENVENKSSATIREEMTSANVTKALGYTPLNKDNVIDPAMSLSYEEGEYAADAKKTAESITYVSSQIQEMSNNIVDPSLATEAGFIADAKLTGDALSELNKKLGTQVTMTLSGTTLTIKTK